MESHQTVSMQTKAAPTINFVMNAGQTPQIEDTIDISDEEE